MLSSHITICFLKEAIYCFVHSSGSCLLCTIDSFHVQLFTLGRKQFFKAGMYSLIHHQGRKHPDYVWSLVFAWYITREYFLPKGSWLVLTASPWFLSVQVQAVGRKAGSPQKHRWVQRCFELWLLQGWSLHSQSHQAAAVGLLILISVVLHAGLNCPWLYRIASGLAVFSDTTNTTSRLCASADFSSSCSWTWTFPRIWTLLQLGI